MSSSTQRLRYEDVIEAHGGLRDDYERGYVAGLAEYAYRTSEAWAESGVLYVGTTGTSLTRRT